MADNNSENEKTDRFTIMQWNCRSIKNKVPYLLHFLNLLLYTPHVLMLQSLNVKVHELPAIQGYYTPVYDKDKNGVVKVATYVKKNVDFKIKNDMDIDTAGIDMYHCTVTIPMKNKTEMNIVNIYYPKIATNRKQVKWIEKLNENAQWVVGGDFNASNPLWDYTCVRDNGKHLADAIMRSSLTTLNDGTFTRLGQNNQRDSAIDISLVSAKNLKSFCWETHCDSMQSDHLPITFSLGEPSVPEIVDRDTSPRFIYKEANWEKFRSVLNELSKKFDPLNLNTEQLLQKIRDMILEAAHLSIPFRTPKIKNKLGFFWWNKACDDAVSKKRKALRQYQKDSNIQNKRLVYDMTRLCHETIHQAKIDHWEDFICSEIKGPADLSKLWEKVRSFNQMYTKPEQPLDYQGRKTENSFEKAEALAKTFAEVSQSENLNQASKEYRKEQEDQFLPPNHNNSTIFNTDLTVDEISTAIRSLSSTGKASGLDPISNRMLTQMPLSMHTILLSLFQKCWQTGSVPIEWKHALVVGIPKPNKPRNNPTSYRPIALTPHIGKLYERIVKNRLVHVLESENKIPLCQAGFRRGRNCMEHVIQLMEHVKRSLHNRQSTVATFFDIKRAFDTVWHKKLLNKIAKLGISGRLYCFIENFLTERKMSVKVGSAISNTYALDMGVPQGSVVAPILFSIMLHDIESEISQPGLFMSLFADDLAIWSDCSRKGFPGKNWKAKYQGHIDSVSNYMRNNGFELSTVKTQLLVFTHHGKDRKHYNFKIGGDILKPSFSVKYLGVWIQQNLEWTEHRNHLIKKARKGVSVVKKLCGKTWATPKSLLHVTNALVRSRLTYGHQVFFTQSKSQWLELERIELRALKAALGVSLRAVNNLVYQQAGLLPLKEYCQANMAIYQVKAKSTNNNVKAVLCSSVASDDDPSRKHEKEKRPNVYRKTMTYDSHTKPVLNMINESSKNDNMDPITVPWSLRKPSFDLNYAPNVSKKSNPTLLKSIVKERIDANYSSCLQVFTDGSILEKEQAGCAFVIPKLDIAHSFSLNNGISIFAAELFAIKEACGYLFSAQNIHKDIIILSDSLSALQSLSRGGTSNRSELQREILNLFDRIIQRGINLTLMWIPSHINLKGNDRADIEAKRGVKKGLKINIGLSTSEIKNKIFAVMHQNRNKYLENLCQMKNWIYLPDKTYSSFSLPRKDQRLICRINLMGHRCFLMKLRCACGLEASLPHIVEGCGYLPHMSPIMDKMRLEGLQLNDFRKKHPVYGEKLIKMLTTAIHKSNLNEWF